MKKWRIYSDIIIAATLIILYLITSSEMSGGELSGRLLAMGTHLETKDIATIITFLATRVIIILLLVPYLGYRFSLAFLNRQKNEFKG